MSTTATTQPEATQQPNPVLGLPDDSSKEYADNKCGPGFSTGTRASVPGPRLRLSRRAMTSVWNTAILLILSQVD